MTEAIRPYPWMCGTCRHKAVRPVFVDYSAEMMHDGLPYVVAVPDQEVLECENCHARMLSDESYERLNDALRRQIGLLTPAEIGQQRQSLGLSQKELADYLQVAPEIVSRWESGRKIQPRGMNRHLLGLFKVPELRSFYQRLNGHEGPNKAGAVPVDQTAASHGG